MQLLIRNPNRFCDFNHPKPYFPIINPIISPEMAKTKDGRARRSVEESLPNQTEKIGPGLQQFNSSPTCRHSFLDVSGIL